MASLDDRVSLMMPSTHSNDDDQDDHAIRRPAGRVRVVRDTRASRMTRTTGFRGSEVRDSENWRGSRASSADAERVSMVMPPSDAQVHYEDELARPSRPAPRTTGRRSEAAQSRISYANISHSSGSSASRAKESDSASDSSCGCYPDSTRVCDGVQGTLSSCMGLISSLLLAIFEWVQDVVSCFAWIGPYIPDIRDYLSWFGLLNIVMLIYKKQIDSEDALRNAFVALLVWWLQSLLSQRNTPPSPYSSAMMV
jgi:hypothetical protein